MGTAAAVEPTEIVRRQVPRDVRRRRLLIAVADHSILIALAALFLLPFVFIVLTAFMTNDQALSARLWPHPFRWHNFIDVFTQAYVAAGVAAGEASQAGGTSTLELGYPQGSTLFYPILLYYHGFQFFQMGYASAMAVLLLAVSFALTLVILRNSRRWVHYGGAVR